MKLYEMLQAVMVAAIIIATNAADYNVEDENTPRGNRQELTCRIRTDHVCIRCSYLIDGTPVPEYFCTDSEDECPAAVCCDILREETCYDEETNDPTSCARRDGGGCPCPSDQERCGVSHFSNGFCTALCCDWRTEQTCHNRNGKAVLCKKYDDGPCPPLKNPKREHHNRNWRNKHSPKRRNNRTQRLRPKQKMSINMRH